MKTYSSQPSTRRAFLARSAAFTLAAAPLARYAAAFSKQPKDSHRILVGTGKGTTGQFGPSGSILAYAWDSATGTLTPESMAAALPDSTWLAPSPDGKYLYVASELDQFQGQPTGAVSSFHMRSDKHGFKLELLSQVNSVSVGTTQCAVDATGHVVVAADYGGGSVACFASNDGRLTPPVWSEHYDGYAAGKVPVPSRQQSAHAHYASFSPDNKYAYVNDLGWDRIHVYKLNVVDALITPAGEASLPPGSGPRTLHFHPNGKIAYCMDEIVSKVTVMRYDPAWGSLTPIQTLDLLPEGSKPLTSTGCDTVLTRDGRFAYFANRGNNFLFSCHVDPATGKLTPFDGDPRSTTGGKTPRNFTLDITERWILVANQDSDQLSVIARDPATGKLANEAKSVACPRPMCIRFV